MNIPHLEQTHIDAIACGSFNNKSYYGYKSSVLKSGICKYFRREQFDKFEWCVIEMMLFGIKNKGLLTNVINRIKILIMEEIACTDYIQFEQCINIFNQIDNESQLKNKMMYMLELCSLLKQFKRGRICSYINNWWRHKTIEEPKNIELDKIKKYAKKNDTDELLTYGELFIKYLQDKDEEMFGIYHKLYNMKNKVGIRYRRKEPVFLLFEIIEDHMKDIKPFQSIFEFIKQMFFRKQMTERRAFGIWLILLVWKPLKNNTIETYKQIIYNEQLFDEYMKNRIRIVINEDYVINDYHVNKYHGIAKFGNVGSLVTNEDLSLLGTNGENYKQFYIDIKNGKQMKVKVVKDVSDINPQNILWDEFSDIKVLEDGVCGMKVCCIRVKYKDKYYILKEMRPSFNYGKDYILLDSLKHIFNIRVLNMKRIKSNVGLMIVDKKIRSFIKNWKLEEREGGVIYCMMDEFINIGDIGKHKHLLISNNSVFKECMKIRLFDGIFRSSDNILRNILVNEHGDLMSIDEGDIYGKRLLIFDKHDWFKRTENKELSKKMIKEILVEWNLALKIDIIEKNMQLYGFDTKINEMKKRINNYEKIVMDELL